MTFLLRKNFMQKRSQKLQSLNLLIFLIFYISIISLCIKSDPSLNPAMKITEDIEGV